MIWYKGYRAEYSKGAEGSQPVLKQRAFTESELKENKKIGNQLSQKKF